MDEIHMQGSAKAMQVKEAILIHVALFGLPLDRFVCIKIFVTQ